MENYIFVNDEIKTEVADTVITINDFYNDSDICEYMIPIPETKELNYKLVNDSNVDHAVDYSL